MADPNADLGRSRVERSALLAVRAFSDAMDRMHTGLRSDMDMNATDLSALRMLSIREQRGELVKPHDLARHLGISSASTTKMLDRLSKEGFIERAPHPKDRRALVITLTESSRQDFGRHFATRLTRMREAMEPFSPDELATVARFLDGMSDAMLAD
ncbi:MULTISPECIES: MarR family winged helix-turn-helix transcriptional regulator [Microbacterium]|jgi:DNA-binding MarR family transcriptional regulator|uniref:MarR family winged helix-turn-helix transcriptional regulator n=1 Tax=Microbacterium TaxID=33882 RepID=UPI000E732589|nr:MULTISPECIES: MarR family transcriptional regulator [Microbacterium]RKE63334.1 DNA-binding MarR family transcriptional regulator [Microbacterium sp. AG238]WJM17022.1 MarR family transcriptional regulator [Microbacterium arborescens]